MKESGIIVFICLCFLSSSASGQDIERGLQSLENSFRVRCNSSEMVSFGDSIVTLTTNYLAALEKVALDSEADEREAILSEITRLKEGETDFLSDGGGPPQRRIFQREQQKILATRDKALFKEVLKYEESLAKLVRLWDLDEESLEVKAVAASIAEMRKNPASVLDFLRQDADASSEARAEVVEKILGVPKIRQAPDYCGPACVAMISQYFGRFVSQESMAEMTSEDSESHRGSRTPDLIDALDRLGFDAEEIDLNSDDPSRTRSETGERIMTAGFELLKEQIDQNRPVMIQHAAESPIGHLELVVGYEERGERKSVFLQDPNSPERLKKTTINQLSEFWFDTRGDGISINCVVLNDPPPVNQTEFRVLPSASELPAETIQEFETVFEAIGSVAKDQRGKAEIRHPAYHLTRRNITRSDKSDATSRARRFAEETGMEILKGEIAMGRPAIILLDGAGGGDVMQYYAFTAYDEKADRFAGLELGTNKAYVTSSNELCSRWVRRVDGARFLDLLYVSRSPSTTAVELGSNLDMEVSAENGFHFTGRFSGEAAEIPQKFVGVKIDWVETLSTINGLELMVGTKGDGVYMKSRREPWKQIFRSSVRSCAPNGPWAGTRLDYNGRLDWALNQTETGTLSDVESFGHAQGRVLVLSKNGEIQLIPPPNDFSWNFEKWAEGERFKSVEMVTINRRRDIGLALSKAGRLYVFDESGAFRLPEGFSSNIAMVSTGQYRSSAHFAVLTEDGDVFGAVSSGGGNLHSVNRQTLLAEWNKIPAEEFGGKLPIAIDCGAESISVKFKDKSWAVFSPGHGRGPKKQHDGLSVPGNFKQLLGVHRNRDDSFFIGVMADSAMLPDSDINRSESDMPDLPKPTYGKLVFEGVHDGTPIPFPKDIRDELIYWTRIRDGKRCLIGTKDRGVLEISETGQVSQLYPHSVKKFAFGFEKSILTWDNQLQWAVASAEPQTMPGVEDFEFGGDGSSQTILYLKTDRTIGLIEKTPQMEWDFKTWAEERRYSHVSIARRRGIAAVALVVSEDGELFAFNKQGQFSLPERLKTGVAGISSGLAGIDFLIVKENGDVFQFFKKTPDAGEQLSLTDYLMDGWCEMKRTPGSRKVLDGECGIWGRSLRLENGAWRLFKRPRDFKDPVMTELTDQESFKYLQISHPFDTSYFILGIR